MRIAFIIASAAIALAVPSSAHAQEFSLTIKDHKFEPAEIKVPANQRITIIVSNEDATAEEFESKSLKVEKVIAGKSKGTVRVSPLKPGRYEFIGEYHESTAKGVLIAE